MYKLIKKMAFILFYFASFKIESNCYLLDKYILKKYILL